MARYVEMRSRIRHGLPVLVSGDVLDDDREEVDGLEVRFRSGHPVPPRLWRAEAERLRADLVGYVREADDQW